MLTVATWNVNSLNARLPHVLDWLAGPHPDILALQETKTIDEKFPLEPLQDAGYNVVFSGQKTYNGVAILSRERAEDIVTDIPQLDDPQRRILVATVNNIRIVNLYVPNGAAVDTDKYAYKLDWLNKVTDFLEHEMQDYPELIVLGDFNIAPEDKDVHDPEAWKGSVLVSPKEREAFQSLCDLGLHDSLRLLNPDAAIYSWWDYRAAAFRRNLGLRIDHILISEALKNHCLSCKVDKTPRTWDRPSDHAPVVAEFDF